jgi:tRNA1Val (adenine37-N6)-methyltransferase
VQSVANNYFQFKQFIINQDNCALKVSTDSCLFGAWAANYLSSVNCQPSSVLDIGAGTGLLMLMLAQKINATIDGIEIDMPSYKQAAENIDGSLWKERMGLYAGDVKTFSFPRKYDFIISNPPFFEADLKSAHANKNIAKHDDGLRLEELADAVDKNITIGGSFALLLPFHRTENFLSIAGKRNFYCSDLMKVKQTPGHNYFRSMLLCRRNQTKTTEKEIIIKDGAGKYTAAFTHLLKDYYLYL